MRLFQTREDESRIVRVRREPRWTISDLYLRDDLESWSLGVKEKAC